MNAKEVEWIMNDIYSSSTEATWENDNADLRHDRNNNSNSDKKGEKRKEKGKRTEEEKRIKNWW